jgi:hypothetical protein
MAWEVLRRHFSRKRAVDVRRINPKVPKEEAVAISGRLLQILADHGPLTVGNTWNHAKVPSLPTRPASSLTCSCVWFDAPWLCSSVANSCIGRNRLKLADWDT